jgi:hypothetical protein
MERPFREGGNIAREARRQARPNLVRKVGAAAVYGSGDISYFGGMYTTVKPGFIIP